MGAAGRCLCFVYYVIYVSRDACPNPTSYIFKLLHFLGILRLSQSCDQEDGILLCEWK